MSYNTVHLEKQKLNRSAFHFDGNFLVSLKADGVVDRGSEMGVQNCNKTW
jgi:hypothetical protein